MVRVNIVYSFFYLFIVFIITFFLCFFSVHEIFSFMVESICNLLLRWVNFFGRHSVFWGAIEELDSQYVFYIALPCGMSFFVRVFVFQHIFRWFFSHSKPCPLFISFFVTGELSDFDYLEWHLFFYSKTCELCDF